MTTTDNNQAFMAGYYGKLPLRGDFIQRNVDSEFIQLWDVWLQNVITNSREILGEQWLNYYLVSPIWRFYLPMQDNSAYCGVMLPSVDKVGRYFPFVIVTQVDKIIPAQTYIVNNEHWFNEAEQLALNALDESIDFEQLNLNIDSLNQSQNLIANDNDTQAQNYRIPLRNNISINEGFSQLNLVLPQKVSNQTNFWWTAGNEHIEGNLFCSNQMPDDNVYTAMLDGQWQLCHMQTSDTNNNFTQNEFT